MVITRLSGVAAEQDKADCIAYAQLTAAAAGH